MTSLRADTLCLSSKPSPDPDRPSRTCDRCIVCVERFVERFNIVIQSCPCNPLDRYDTDGVLVTHFQGFFGVECGFVKSQGHFAHFNLPQLGKLFPYHLETGGDNEVRLIEWRARLFSRYLFPESSTSWRRC